MTEKHPFDRSAKWLLEHHPDIPLRLAGIRNIVGWRARPGDVVLPRQQPDSIIEVQLSDRKEPVYAIVEVNTYPHRRNVEQARTDALMLLMAKGTLPEMVMLVLHPKGQYRTESQEQLASALATMKLELSWVVINLWEVPAEQLFALDDPGAVPWAVLAQTDLDEQTFLTRCRDEILRLAPEQERGNLLAVAWVLGRIRYDEQDLRAVFGWRQAVIESPFYDDLLNDPEFVEKSPVHRRILAEKVAERAAEMTRKHILEILEVRLGPLPDDLAPRLDRVTEKSALEELHHLAKTCSDFDAFRARLPS